MATVLQQHEALCGSLQGERGMANLVDADGRKRVELRRVELPQTETDGEQVAEGGVNVLLRDGAWANQRNMSSPNSTESERGGGWGAHGKTIRHRYTPHFNWNTSSYFFFLGPNADPA